ncbi:hypothetical protein [Hydrocarboniclastica marina]|uniref:Uncharacterized protein n=1 Tax=Hydrocarboniclastica marina TaxID=2259620 RepID=A0A4P7XJN9_9ALTE|nr:hypothetical protein [Hydrocarboniclastica marina]QCF27356.1 hypothetical protein soil367_16255 [Hydrocarboniclastica marina]
MFQLVFKGQCQPGVAPETARANVAQVFKASQAQIERMFSGERVVIRNKLESDAAEKFKAALAKQGIVVHIEPMPGASSTATQAGAEAVQRPAPGRPVAPTQEYGQAKPQAAGPATAGVVVEPGERLSVAGERVDEVLAGSRLTLGRPGETLGQPKEQEAPVFHELESWSLAQPGARLVEPEEAPPVAVPDTSHLKVLPPGETG